MEAIKINVEIGLKESTLAMLENIAEALTHIGHDKPEPKQPKLETKQATPEPKQPKLETKQATPAKTENAEEEAETATAPASAREITDSELREAVKECKSRVPVSEIRNSIFAKYGIESSVECPENRRAELLHDLLTYETKNA